MADIGTKEAAKKFGVTQKTVENGVEREKSRELRKIKKGALGIFLKMQRNQK